MAALLQEIVSVYPLLSPPALTAHASNRVCNALALLQCVASHSETRQLFLNGWWYAIDPRMICPYPCINSTYPPFPLSLPQYDVKNPTVRVSSPHLAWGHWRTCQGTFAFVLSRVLLLSPFI